MYNIEIDAIKLPEVIALLTKDNEEIEVTLSEIRTLIERLDDDVWNSPEKKKITEELIPYLKFKEDDISDNINNYISHLNKALNAYISQDQTLKSNANKLSDFNI